MGNIILNKNINSIAIPPLGCGLGGLQWKEVREVIEKKLSKLIGVRIIIFKPSKSLDIHESVKSQTSPKMTPGRAALVELINDYLGGLLAPSITLLEVHKLMYFMQEAGENLILDFQKPNMAHTEKIFDMFYMLWRGTLFQAIKTVGILHLKS